MHLCFRGMRGTHMKAHARSWVHKPAAKSIKSMLLNLFLMKWWNSGGISIPKRPKALGRHLFVTVWTRRGPNLAYSVLMIVQCLERRKV